VICDTQVISERTSTLTVDSPMWRALAPAPVHPGDVLRHDFLEPLACRARSGHGAARATHRITTILAGDRAVSAETALRLARTRHSPDSGSTCKKPMSWRSRKRRRRAHPSRVAPRRGLTDPTDPNWRMTRGRRSGDWTRAPRLNCMTVLRASYSIIEGRHHATSARLAGAMRRSGKCARSHPIGRGCQCA